MFVVDSVIDEPGSVEYVMLNPFAKAAISDVRLNYALKSPSIRNLIQ